MIDTCKERYAEDIDIADQLDLDGDEYGDNDNSMFGYATVIQRNDLYLDGESWITLTTSQGTFQVPASHRMKVKVIE